MAINTFGESTSFAHKLCMRASNEWITANRNRTSNSYFIISFPFPRGIRAVAAYTLSITHSHQPHSEIKEKENKIDGTPVDFRTVCCSREREKKRRLTRQITRNVQETHVCDSCYWHAWAKTKLCHKRHFTLILHKNPDFHPMKTTIFVDFYK